MKRFWWLLLTLASLAHAVPRTEFTVVNGEEPRSLDPQKVGTRAEARIAAALFEGLVSYDAAGEARPALADKWSIDGTSGTFRLRRTSWSDGVAITAQTVAGSWKRGLDAKLAPLVRWIASIRAVDERTVEVTFTEPLPTLSILADPAFAVLPMHLVDAYGTLWAQPAHLAVNGPFKLDSWTLRTRLVLVPNTVYWDRASVRLTKITLLPGDFDAGEPLFRSAAADWLPDAPPGRLDPARHPRTDHVDPALGSYFLRLNVGDPVLADARVRRALALAFDRSALVREVLHSGKTAAYSLVPVFPNYAPPPFGKADAAAARRLLTEAGYPGGKGFPVLTLLYNTGETHRKILEFLADEWKRNLGIDADLKQEGWTAYLDDMGRHNYQAARSAWLGDYNDPLTFLGLFVSDSPDNYTGYSNAAYDGLVAKGAAQAGDARVKTFRQAEAVLEADLPLIPIYHDTAGNRIDLTRWTGWTANPLDVHSWKDIAPRPSPAR